jgi:hypothetical protein
VRKIHKNIFDRLEAAGKGKNGSARFEAELAKMKDECTTIGSEMNKIITKTY